MSRWWATDRSGRPHLPGSPAPGHRVAAFERFDEIYRLPRAVHMDHEITRLMQDLGLADRLVEEMIPLRDYHWFGADGEPVMTLNSPQPSASGWEPGYLFFQPELEEALEGAGIDGVDLHRGWVVEELNDLGHETEITVGRHVRTPADQTLATDEVRTVRAGWVIGADGANRRPREGRHQPA